MNNCTGSDWPWCPLNTTDADMGEVCDYADLCDSLDDCPFIKAGKDPVEMYENGEFDELNYVEMTADEFIGMLGLCSGGFACDRTNADELLDRMMC